MPPGGRPHFLGAGLAGAPPLPPPSLATRAPEPPDDAEHADAAAHDDGLIWRRGRAALPPEVGARARRRCFLCGSGGARGWLLGVRAIFAWSRGAVLTGARASGALSLLCRPRAVRLFGGRRQRRGSWWAPALPIVRPRVPLAVRVLPQQQHNSREREGRQRNRQGRLHRQIRNWPARQPLI